VVPKFTALDSERRFIEKLLLTVGQDKTWNRPAVAIEVAGEIRKITVTEVGQIRLVN
jgi:hypothetical protein